MRLAWKVSSGIGCVVPRRGSPPLRSHCTLGAPSAGSRDRWARRGVSLGRCPSSFRRRNRGCVGRLPACGRGFCGHSQHSGCSFSPCSWQGRGSSFHATRCFARCPSPPTGATGHSRHRRSPLALTSAPTVLPPRACSVTAAARPNPGLESGSGKKLARSWRLRRRARTRLLASAISSRSVRSSASTTRSPRVARRDASFSSGYRSSRCCRVSWLPAGA